MNLDFFILMLATVESIAPPLAPAVLNSKVQLSITVPEPLLAICIAPPSEAAVLYLKIESVISKSLTPVLSLIDPPPIPVATLSSKVQLLIVILLSLLYESAIAAAHRARLCRKVQFSIKRLLPELMPTNSNTPNEDVWSPSLLYAFINLIFFNTTGPFVPGCVICSPVLRVPIPNIRAALFPSIVYP